MKKIFFISLLAVFVLFMVVGTASAATTISTNINTGGTLTVTGTSTLTGAITAAGLLNANGGIAVDTTAFTVADTTGNTAIGGTLTVTGASTLNGSLTVGDAVADGLILNGRVSTGSAAGTTLTLDSTYAYGEGQELRYKVTDWTNVGDGFRAIYARAENGVDGLTKGVYGAELYATANDGIDTGTVQGLLSYAYLKGTGVKTVGPAYGIHGELTFDAGQSTQTITTEAAPILAKITGGVVDTYTKIQGIIVRAGDMDGASRTYGNAILVEDDSSMAGTITWTRGLKLSAPSTVDIELQNGEVISNSTDGTISFGAANIVTTGALLMPTSAETLVDAADAGDSCAAANKGSIVIDAANLFYGCDGTNWQKLDL